jgi:hypothetical protein
MQPSTDDRNNRLWVGLKTCSDRITLKVKGRLFRIFGR